MQQRHLGRSGLRVSRLGLGTKTWGGSTDADEAAAQLDAFHQAGGTLIDTANVYSHGRGEEILGSLLDQVAQRDALVIAGKSGAPTGSGPFDSGASRGALLGALRASLGRLGVEHLDLWQLHTWDPDTPIEETVAAAEHAVRSGMVRYVGVSNYCGWQLAAAVAAAGLPVVSNQVEYSLAERGVEREVVPAAGHLGVGLLPWAPLGRGLLTGKYRHGTPSDSRAADAATAGDVEQHRTERTARVVEAVVTAADGLGASAVSVALAWVRDRPEVVAPVVGARDAAQLQASLASESVTLPPAIQAALDDVSEPETGYPERPCPEHG